jgi:hypothetical protein
MRCVPVRQRRATAASAAEENKLERVMQVWSAFFECALGGGSSGGDGVYEITVVQTVAVAWSV